MKKQNTDLSVFDGPYYTLSKNLLVFFGLWPEINKKRKIFCFLFYHIAILSMMIPMIAGLIYYAHRKNWVKSLENLTGLLYFTVIMKDYNSHYVLKEKVKLLYKIIASDWQRLTDKNELDILHKYSQFSRSLTIFYIYYSVLGSMITLFLPLIPVIMDEIVPLKNETRIRVQPIHPYYFGIIDLNRYYYHMHAFHFMTTGIYNSIIYLAINSMHASCIQHVRGLFAITWCIHMIRNSFGVGLIVLVSCIIIGIPVLIFDLLFYHEHPFEKVILIVLILGIQMIFFVLSWTMQQLTDSNEKVFLSVYSCNWFNLSIKGQKLVYLLMLRTIKTVTIRTAGIFEINLQQFAKVLKMSLSCAMVMQSINST